MTKKLPEKWNKNQKALKAIQVAFELEQDIAKNIRVRAAKNGLTPSDQIRKILGLTYSPPKRPRLTVSLSQDDYKELGKKFGIDPGNTIDIKRKIVEALIDDNSVDGD